MSIKHADVGGCSNMTQVMSLVGRFEGFKTGPRMVSSFCKDHHFGFAVPTVESCRMLTPQVHSEVTVTYHDDALYWAGLEKRPHFLLRSCRTSTGWFKRRL
jgi:hypothetical protein